MLINLSMYSIIITQNFDLILPNERVYYYIFIEPIFYSNIDKRRPH